MSQTMPDAIHAVDINDKQTKDWVNINDDRTDPMYDPNTYCTSGRARAFAWRAKDDVPEHRYTDPDCPGELLVEYVTNDDGHLGRMYAYGTGPKPIPLRMFMKLRYAAENDTKVKIRSPVRGGAPKSSPGQFVHNELDFTVKSNPEAFGYEDNYEEFTPNSNP